MSASDHLILLVLAGGMSTRFRADKQLFRLSSLYQPLLYFTLFDARRAGIERVVIVTRSSLQETFEQELIPHFPELKFNFVLQDLCSRRLSVHRTKPWGTGHAVLCAKPFLDHPFLVVNADDYYGRNVFFSVDYIFRKFGEDLDHCFCIGYRLGETLSQHGPVSRGLISIDKEKRSISHITEYTQIQRQSDGSITGFNTETQQTVSLRKDQDVSLNLFGLTPAVFPPLKHLFQQFLKQNAHSDSAEFFLPKALMTPGVLPSPLRLSLSTCGWFGITYPKDVKYAERKLNAFIEEGDYS